MRINISTKIGYDQFPGVHNYDVALKYFGKSLAFDQKHYDRDHPETSVTLDNICEILGSLRDYRKQRDLFIQPFVTTVKNYVQDHPKTVVVFINLGAHWIV